ncbi:MAG: hypothetical protein N5P05_002012 [Chroococcopsis gigantea SAG 12.99]|jgi:hypothetical protein|nr:hypothetical protein [Chlorogloea purpurea SAG 13.99]MDV3000406.1 hypothetical protein [Chroococcopsis gigantea SAG 12.99]
MELDSLPTEVILTHPHENLGKIQLDWVPQPGNYLALKGKTYTVLERHHHYQYKIGGYALHKISLYVQVAQIPTERTLLDGRWVIGDAKCRLNARSELIRCAVNPEGPCQDCRFFELSPA